MKRLAVWAFYAIGTLAILYLALFAYAVFTGRQLQPGDPIRIFRNPDAPNYSAAGDRRLWLTARRRTMMTFVRARRSGAR